MFWLFKQMKQPSFAPQLEGPSVATKAEMTGNREEAWDLWINHVIGNPVGRFPFDQKYLVFHVTNGTVFSGWLM